MICSVTPPILAASVRVARTSAPGVPVRRRRGIGSGVHYPAMHLFTLYRRLGWKEGDFPHAERIGRSIVSLPLFPSMDDSDVDRVVEAVDDTLHRLV